MSEEKHRNKAIDRGSIIGVIWYIGWWFTIGFIKLTFWQGVLALIIWPYYLGETLSIS